MNYTRTWKDHNKAEKQAEQKPLAALFAFLVLTIAVMLKIAHIY